jgi:uncharacterized protein YcsI (UPF0317 family)
MTHAAPRDVRALARAGRLMRPTCGMAPGFVQANLVILPRDVAFDFLVFCQRNPKSCPDVNRPDFGDAVRIDEGEVPVFWACGVTSQAVAMRSRPPLMITHSPGYMFVTDRRDADYAVL